MKVIEKPWQYGTYLVYDEVEPEFIATEKGVRVLPAPFFYDKKQYYELHKRYEPGEKKTFPNGGYEVVDISGGIRSYDLDQVIIHPAVLKHKKMLDKMARRAEKEQRKRERRNKKAVREARVKHGRRGRPSLDPTVKAQRDALKAQKNQTSGGKRGRPRSTEPKQPKPLKATGGRRGRPALTAEIKAQREQAKVNLKQRTGGKRGRPRR
jgi:hypothetical protein